MTKQLTYDAQADFIQWRESYTLEGPTGGTTSKLWIDYDETFAIEPDQKYIFLIPATRINYDFTMDWNYKGYKTPVNFNWMRNETFSLCFGAGIPKTGLPGINIAELAKEQATTKNCDFMTEFQQIKWKLLHAMPKHLHIRLEAIYKDTETYIKNLLKNGVTITLEVLGKRVGKQTFLPSRRKTFELAIPFNMLQHPYGSKTQYEFHDDVTDETVELWTKMLNNLRKDYNNAAWAAATTLMDQVKDSLNTPDVPQPEFEVTEEIKLYVSKYASAYGYNVKCWDSESTSTAPTNQFSGKPGYAGTTWTSYMYDSEPFGGGLTPDVDARRMEKAIVRNAQRESNPFKADPDYIIAEAYQAIQWLRTHNLVLDTEDTAECTCGEVLSNIHDEFCPTCNNYNLNYQVPTLPLLWSQV